MGRYQKNRGRCYFGKSKINRKKILFLSLGLILLSSYLSVSVLGKMMNAGILRYANLEAKRVTISIINTSVNEMIEEKKLQENLFEITKNQAGEIQMIDFDTKSVNQILKRTSENIQRRLIALEEGNTTDIEVSENLKGKNFPNRKKGIVCETNSGSIFGNSLFANMGPVIPVKLTFIGNVQTSIDTQIKDYGINNAYLEVNIEVTITERIVIPTYTEEAVIKRKIPIAMKVIEGKIPAYYLEGLQQSSPSYTLPIEE